jgi:TolA-binding protein
MRSALILALLALPATAAPPTTCGSTDDYSVALCAYQHRHFADAEKGFRAIAESGDKSANAIKSTYFLARTLMKTGRFEEASRLFRRIYELDKPFYDEWQCDYLLGECRRAEGRG